MPLPTIIAGQTMRCAATCKARGDRCHNPAAYGAPVCRYHGAKRSEVIKRGVAHWNYQHGKETLEARAGQSKRLAELRELEALTFEYGLVPEGSPRWRGRKPKRC